MTKARDFAMMVGRSEALNPTRVSLLDGDAVTVADSATVSSIVGNVGTAVYDSLGALPVAGLTAGQQAFVSANNRLYIYIVPSIYHTANTWKRLFQYRFSKFITKSASTYYSLF